MSGDIAATDMDAPSSGVMTKRVTRSGSGRTTDQTASPVTIAARETARSAGMGRCQT